MHSQVSRSRSRRVDVRWFWGITASVVACLVIAVAVGQSEGDNGAKSAAVVTLEETGRAFADVTAKASPAVVYIHVEKGHAKSQGHPLDRFRGHPQEEMLKRFFGERGDRFETPRTPRSAGQGSGFIISKDGYILTNAHVVRGADKLEVRLSDGKEYAAKIVGVDARTDVAVIKVDGKNLPVLKMGDSEDIQVGQWVLAVGSPFGLPGTVTSGIVSAKDRSGMGITEYENFIQTDAAINPGNSGGPLVNLEGEAVGINTAIFSRSGGYMGIGFAIPINMAKDISDALIRDGSVTRGYLGIMIQEFTPALAKSFAADGTEGVLVGDVVKDSPADSGGIQIGDVIRKFDGRSVRDVDSFRKRVASISPNDEAKLTVLRGGKQVALTVTIGQLGSSSPDTGATRDGGDESTDKLGLKLGALNDETRQRLGYKGGAGVVVLSVKPGSRAADAGVRARMVIKQVNRQAVSSLDDVRRQLNESKESPVLLLVDENGQTRFIAIE